MGKTRWVPVGKIWEGRKSGQYSGTLSLGLLGEVRVHGFVQADGSIVLSCPAGNLPLNRLLADSSTLPQQPGSDEEPPSDMPF